MNSYRLGTTALVVILLIALAQPASAYTDPGSGTLLFQILTASFVGGMFYIRRAIMTLWRKRK